MQNECTSVTFTAFNAFNKQLEVTDKQSMAVYAVEMRI